MKLTRSEIKKYLDDEFKKTDYYKKTRRSNISELEVLKNMTIHDLDFVHIFNKLLKKIKANCNKFSSNPNWAPSLRQKKLLEITNNIKIDIATKTNKDNIHLHGYEDFYWQIWDYFDDYGNSNELICKEEFDVIILQVEDLLNTFDNEIKNH